LLPPCAVIMPPLILIVPPDWESLPKPMPEAIVPPQIFKVPIEPFVSKAPFKPPPIPAPESLPFAVRAPFPVMVNVAVGLNPKFP